MKRLVIGFSFILMVVSNLGSATELDDMITAKVQQPEVLSQGQTLFEQICASCHGKDLTGGSGFNLKDAEWVHGSKPSQIINNVKTGFMNAGMPGFGAVFTEPQLQSIVAYILSKREGWSDLTYKLYQLDDENDKDITEDKLIKTGSLPKGLADYSIPEIQHYFIEFEGDFYAPTDIDSQIWLEWGFPHEVNMYVDGEQVERTGSPWYPTWRLKRGKQHLRITYRSGTTKPQQRNLVMLGTTLDLKVKLFAVSSRAKAILEGKKYEVKAESETVIQRKRIHELPPFSISVGLPSKMNYAFNTKSCSIVGLWQGELLNIGPNIAGRGEDPSLPLGEWVFKYPLEVAQATESSCKYLGYQLVNGEPHFSYQVDGRVYRMFAESSSNNSINFNLRSESKHQLTMSLPMSEKVSWTINNKKITELKTSVTMTNQLIITAQIQ
ncbi:MAG: cytochrome c [Gammaproteobacteria bacterium]|nr:cytochrome c [Gammaproteobacteria bacterium]